MIRNKFIDHLQRLWYEVVWVGVFISFRFYFRRWQVANYPKMGRKEPVIYVANHQNAFLDALAIIMSQRRHPLFLVRANIFAKKLARFALRSLNMLPIYRLRDGKENLAKNDAIIQDCIDMLIDGRQPVAIFVEGNHNLKRSLRPLKKGVSRIAFSALEQTDFTLDLKIVPIGLTYSKHTRFRSDLLVNYGAPISIKDYLDVYRHNPNKAHLELIRDIEKRLEPLMVNIADHQHYEEIEQAWINQHQEYDNMLTELEHDQQLIARLTQEARAGRLQPAPPTARPAKPLQALLGFPAFAVGLLNTLPLFYIMRQLIGKLVTDIHFYGSIKVGAAMVLAPLVFGLQATGVYALTGGNVILSWFYFFASPFFGTFAYDYYLRHLTDLPPVTASADLLRNYK